MNKSPNSHIGVIICDCGTEIANILNTQSLEKIAFGLPGVDYSHHEAFPCSRDGCERIIAAIKEHELKRILVAGCSHRLVGSLFENTLKLAGLEPSYLDIRNIREHCSYVHSSNPEAAFQKAKNLIEMGVARLAELTLPKTNIGSITKSVLIIGGSLSGLTAAITLYRNGIPVILVESSDSLGGDLFPLQSGAKELIEESIQLISKNDQIQTYLKSRITDITGQLGNYQVTVIQDELTRKFNIGAIIVATSAQPKSNHNGQWYDSSRIKTQLEFAVELAQASSSSVDFPWNNVVMVLYEDATNAQSHSALNCMNSIHQAIALKELDPDINVTILFRNLYFGTFGSRGEEIITYAKDLGVTFFRYQEDFAPVVSDKSVDLIDELTEGTIHIPYDQVVLITPLIPHDDTDSLAILLRLSQDEAGFIVKPRIRLRPGHYMDDGIFVMGGAHHPVDTSETLFQAYLNSVRVLNFLNKEKIQTNAPSAVIQSDLCTGCGNCVQVCPMSAIRLEKRDGILSLSEVDFLRCTGCGNCVVICPVKAIEMPGWNDAAILAQISASLSVPGELNKKNTLRIIALVCEWSALAAADLAGTRKHTYPPNVRIIRMNCSARFDPNHILWAFLSGADGVFLGTCYPGECHYGTGNLYAKERAEVLRNQLLEHGVEPHRLRLEFFAGDEELKFAEVISEFIEEITTLDPLGFQVVPE